MSKIEETHEKIRILAVKKAHAQTEQEYDALDAEYMRAYDELYDLEMKADMEEWDKAQSVVERRQERGR